MSLRASLVLIGLFFVALHALVLPPEGFVTGDQGSKFLQARAFADRDPLNPDIDVQARDIDPGYRYQEPKLENRRGRLVSEFLWLLPALSAPFLHVLGMRGLYVVPALSVILIFLVAAALGRRLGDTHGLRTAWFVLLVTPAALYGLELWEHAPAAACVMVAALVLVPVPRQREAWRFMAAGAALAAGFLFREEVIAALPALLIARAISMERDRLKDLLIGSSWTMVGAGLVFAASVPVNLAIYGAALPMHLTQDAWEVAKAMPYMQVRRDVMFDLLLPGSHVAVFVAAGAAAIAAAMTQMWKRRRGGSGEDPTGWLSLAVVHTSVIVLLVIAVVIPVWRLAHGVRPHDAYSLTSAAHTWPFLAALVYWPWVANQSHRPIARYLIVAALLLIAGTAAVVPTSGGAQWSPRFFLAAAPMLAVVAAAAMPESFHPASPGSRAIRAMALLILICSVAMQASGIFYVQRLKTRHARITHWIAAHTAPGDVLITDVFWFPEITATLAPERRMLFSWSSGDVPSMAALAVKHGFRRFHVVNQFELTAYEPPETLDVPGVPCRFTRIERLSVGELGLYLNRYACEGW